MSCRQDAILETNDLKLPNLKVTPLNTGLEITFVATHIHSKAELGYIRYKRDDNTIELTNYNSWLNEEALAIGSTSKKGKSGLAGSHGDGLKAAALVLNKHGLTVTIAASECEWIFFEGQNGTRQQGYLCYSIKSKPHKSEKNQVEYLERSGRVRERKARIWEDVSVFITTSTYSVREEEFWNWVRGSLVLSPPKQMIRTKYGNIILDQRYENMIFSRGILLEQSRDCKNKFKFGYDIPKANTNQDREWLAEDSKKFEMLAEIWARAITIDPRLARRYRDMLQADPCPSDVGDAQFYIGLKPAKHIWQLLCSENESREKFYYYEGCKPKDIDFIEKILAKTPVKLSRSLWNVLYNNSLVRTPQEHQIHKAEALPEAIDPQTAFSAGVQRLLLAALSLDARTRKLTIKFKTWKRNHLDVVVCESKAYINSKWLSFTESHVSSPCSISKLKLESVSADNNFICSHIVTTLYLSVLESLNMAAYQRLFIAPDFMTPLHQQVSEKLRQMPCMVESRGTTYGQGIEIYWANLEGNLDSALYGFDPKCRVTLHRDSTCSKRRDDLVASNSSPLALENQLCKVQSAREPQTTIKKESTTIKEEAIKLESIIKLENGVIVNDVTFATAHTNIAKCGCPETIVSQKSCKATFFDLQKNEKYFPMVCRDEVEAFYALPPASIAPGSDVSTTTLSIAGQAHDFVPGRGKQPLIASSCTLKIEDEVEMQGLRNVSHRSDTAASIQMKIELRNQNELIQLRDHQLREQSSQLQELKNQNSDLETQLHNQMAQSEVLKNQLLKKDLELKEALGLNKTQSQSLEALHKDLETSKSTISDLRTIEEKANLAITSLQNNVQELSKKNEELTQQNATLENDLEIQMDLAARMARRRGGGGGVKRKRENEGEDGDKEGKRSSLKVEGDSADKGADDRYFTASSFRSVSSVLAKEK